MILEIIWWVVIVPLWVVAMYSVHLNLKEMKEHKKECAIIEEEIHNLTERIEQNKPNIRFNKEKLR